MVTVDYYSSFFEVEGPIKSEQRMEGFTEEIGDT